MFQEECFHILYLLPIYAEQMAETAVGKFIDDGSADEEGEMVIDQRSDERSQGCEKYHEENIHLTVCRLVGGRCDDQLGW